MANYTGTATSITLNGDGVTTDVVIDLAAYPFSVPFAGRFPDRVIVSINDPNTQTTTVVPATLKRSVVSFALPHPQPPTDGAFALGITIVQQFDLI